MELTAGDAGLGRWIVKPRVVQSQARCPFAEIHPIFHNRRFLYR